MSLALPLTHSHTGAPRGCSRFALEVHDDSPNTSAKCGASWYCKQSACSSVGIWRDKTFLGLILTLCVTLCVCVSGGIYDFKKNYLHLTPALGWQQSTKCARAHEYIRLLNCMSIAAGGMHLRIFLPAVRSIIPDIWQPKPVKKTFLLASVFKGSDTGDSQPQEPHILQSRCILRNACITESPQTVYRTHPSSPSMRHTHARAHMHTGVQDTAPTHPCPSAIYSPKLWGLIASRARSVQKTVPAAVQPVLPPRP